MKNLGLVLLGVLLTACKGGGGGGGGSSAPDVISYGVYQICEYDSNSDMSSRSLIYINETLLSEVITYYNGANCQSGNEAFDERYVYSYSNTGSAYRLAVEAYTSSSLSAPDVTYNNTNSYCGFSNWVLNVPKNALGRDCLGTTINQGDYIDVTAVKTGSSLAVTSQSGTTTYALTGAWDFTNQGQTVANGNWVFYDGSQGAYLTTNSGNYSITYYDPATLRYFTENGTYTSANNVMTSTVVSYVPDCGTDEGSTDSKSFSQTSFSLAIKDVGALDILLEKVPYTNVQFRDSFLGAGYSAGCF